MLPDGGEEPELFPMHKPSRTQVRRYASARPDSVRQVVRLFFARRLPR
ncbi:hypothetical protein SUDANB176_00073 [Streptomyces sp. enrichment culture]